MKRRVTNATKSGCQSLQAVWQLLAVWALVCLTNSASAVSVVQQFFVPMPEEQIRQNFLVVAPNTLTEFNSVISMVVPVTGTTIVFDHWEDGYEVDIENPSQATTGVWGDGNNANGVPPGFVNDPVGFTSGAVLALRNIVPLPRTSTILHDGRDRVGSSQAIVMTRAAWATVPGPLLADAVSVPSTADYGTSFVIPLGQDVIFPAPLTASMFEDCALFVMAAENNTLVQIDADANGSAEISVTINRGQSYLANGTVNKSATVTASKPVQVQLITGDIGANYESRWFNIPPSVAWSSDYYSPVGTAADGDQTCVWLYNPNTVSAITINYLTKVGSGSFSVPAKAAYQFLMPQNSGARFISTGSAPFFAMGTVGANPTANNVHDWGFNLVPSTDLTTELVVGWGPGSRDLTQNGNPAWITAVGPTTLYVDYNGDRAGPLTDPKPAYPNNNFLDDVVDVSNYVLVGNRIWNDNGLGGGVANDGLRNGTEPGIDGVTVEVYAADGLGYPTAPMLSSDVTAEGGYYSFFLPPGDYVIRVPPSNFGSGQPLVGLFSSGTSNATRNGADPDAFPADIDDNGYNSIVPTSTGVMTAAFTLTSSGEPTGEGDLGPGDNGVADNRANLTVDLGFASVAPTAIKLAYVKGWWEADEVTVEWETISEVNTLGFELYRLESEGPVLVNPELVPARNVDLGGVYRVRETMSRPRGMVRYLLVELETTGRSLEYGPFEIAVAPPAQVMSVRMVKGGLELRFTGEPEVEYLIETTDDLTLGRWTESGSSRSDPAGVIQFLQSVAGSEPARFFRALRR